MHIRKGDSVQVIAGDARYHGKVGRVLAVYAKTERVLVEGVNIVRHHQKTVSQQQGGIIEREAPIHVSNVMPWCESANRPSKVVLKRLEDGKRVRVFKINGETLKDEK